MEPPSCCPESDMSAKVVNSTELKEDDPTEQVNGIKLDSTDDREQPLKPESSPMDVDVDKVSGTSNDKAVTSSSAVDTTDSFDCSIKDGLPPPTDGAKENGFVDAKKEDATSEVFSLKSSKVSRNDEGSNHHKEESAKVNKLEPNRVQQDNSNKNEEHDRRTEFSGSELHVKDSNMVQKKSGTDLDYDIEDPLELARLVAIEAKREVDCREQSCSSSDKLPGGEAPQPDSPDSACGAESCPQEEEGSLKDSSSSAELDVSVDSSLPGEQEEPGISSKVPDSGPVNGTVQEVESSQVAEGAQENSANSDKGLCNFDLNMDVYSEDVDHLENNLISNTVSVVSASRAAAVPGLPVAPLQFEGALGWKGSAATSAFRPASPRRNSEMDKSHSTGGSNSSSKQRDGCLDIDLNANESVDERSDHPFQEKRPVLSGLPSGESSVDASPRRSERIDLDLNRASDDGDARLDWRMDGPVFHQRNGYVNQSPSSSSSSKQPVLRNIDLNDQPSLANESADHNSFLSRFSHQSFSPNPGVKRADDAVISIMGMKVEVNRKDFFSPHSQPLPLFNGRNFDPTMDTSLARNIGPIGMGPAIQYPHPASYGYSGGITSGPALPFSPAMYGPGGSIPYMLDSRGAPVVPQVMGSASTVPPGFPHHPYLMSVSGPGAVQGPSRNSFDLNSGLTLEGGANRDTGGFRQFLNPGHHPFLMDDYMKSSNSQASTSSGSGVKRKEPDSGWEAFPFRHGNRM